MNVFEAKGTSIDQGGDDNHYELYFSDGCDLNNLNHLKSEANQLLNEIDKAFNIIGIKKK